MILLWICWAAQLWQLNEVLEKSWTNSVDASELNSSVMSIIGPWAEFGNGAFAMMFRPWPSSGKRNKPFQIALQTSHHAKTKHSTYRYFLNAHSQNLFRLLVRSAPASKHALSVRSILISKTLRPVICWNPLYFVRGCPSKSDQVRNHHDLLHVFL